MDILQKIKDHKVSEVAQRRSDTPLDALKDSPHYSASTFSLTQALRTPGATGVISEFKKKSPSEGFINQNACVKEVTTGYIQAGASALSVLTDEHFFGGTSEDLQMARKHNRCPILRKDFIIDEYQIHETKSMGADVILLIAEILTADQVENFSALARSLGIEVLLEIHSEEQLDKYTPSVNVIGVNNRNLKNFKVDIQHSIDLFDRLPEDSVKISESGISQVSDMVRLADAGYEGFLIGTQFMKTADPVNACRTMLEEYKNQQKPI